MPKHVNDFLGQLHAIALFVVMLATPLAILVLGIVNFVRSKVNRATIVLQALASLAVWIVVTFALFMIFFMTVFEYPAYRSRADQIKGNAIFVGGSLIYLVVAVVLIYWTKRQTKRSRIAS